MPEECKTFTKYQPITIDFQQTYELDGKEVNSVKMRPPTCGDVINAQTMARTEDHEKPLLYANLCNVPESFVNELSQYDWLLMGSAYSRFLFPLQTFCEMSAQSLADDLEDMISSGYLS